MTFKEGHRPCKPAGVKCTVAGVTYSAMSEACKVWGLPVWTLRRTLEQSGWRPLTVRDIQEAVGRSRQRRAQLRVYAQPWTDHTGKEYPSFTAMCAAWGVRRALVKHRVNRGWGIEAALTVPLYGKQGGESDGGAD